MLRPVIHKVPRISVGLRKSYMPTTPLHSRFSAASSAAEANDIPSSSHLASSAPRNPLIAILGPTGTGKSDVSISFPISQSQQRSLSNDYFPPDLTHPPARHLSRHISSLAFGPQIRNHQCRRPPALLRSANRHKPDPAIGATGCTAPFTRLCTADRAALDRTEVPRGSEPRD